MSDFKSGDLAMIIKLSPCCTRGTLGKIFTVGSTPFKARSRCSICGDVRTSTVIARSDDYRRVINVVRLKKIDPPAEGDSLPTRRDLEVPA